MTDGYFDGDGQPFVSARVVLLNLGIAGRVHFLVDTGTDATILHPEGATRLNCPFDDLENPVEVTSAGGPHTYYAEPAVVSFYDGEARYDYRIELSVAKPHPAVNDLDSLLGRDVLNRLRMDYAYPEGRLRFYP